MDILLLKDTFISETEISLVINILLICFSLEISVNDTTPNPHVLSATPVTHPMWDPAPAVLGEGVRDVAI